MCALIGRSDVPSLRWVRIFGLFEVLVLCDDLIASVYHRDKAVTRLYTHSALTCSCHMEKHKHRADSEQSVTDHFTSLVYILSVFQFKPLYFDSCLCFSFIPAFISV